MGETLIRPLGRGAGDEEDPLPLDEGPVLRLDPRELLAHADPSLPIEVDRHGYHSQGTSVMVQAILV